MKLKKMKKALKNIERGAVTVSKKDKKYDLTDCPDKWDDRKIVDSYKTEGKNGGITLVIGGKTSKKKSDKPGSDIDESIAQIQKNLDTLSNDEIPEEHDRKDHRNKDRNHDQRDNRAERKADDLIRDATRQNDRRENNRRDNNRNNNQRSRQNRGQRDYQNRQNASGSENEDKQED